MAVDQGSINAYNAALVTRDRAIQGRQDAIDVLNRLLAQMGDDPLVVKAKENLQKLLENPEVITDEVFGNIMSKTTEVMDSNYNTQVSEVLNAARSKGITGPALQATLQKAKESRAIAIAGAYRDALIERANSGLKTNLDAINATSNLLNNLFNQQRVVSEDLANVMRETVEEPFLNVTPDLPQAGVVNAPAQYTPIDNGIAALNARTPALGSDYIPPDWADSRNPVTPANSGTVYGNQANGLPGTAESAAAAEKAAQDRMAADQIAAWGSQAKSEPGTGYIMGADGVKLLVDKMGNITKEAPTGSGGVVNLGNSSTPSWNVNALQSAIAGPVGALSDAAKASSSSIQNAVTGAISGLTGIGDQIAQQFASSLQPASTIKAADTVIPGTNAYTAGGTAEANRVAGLVGTINPKTGKAITSNDLIGTTSGAGVRTPAVSAAEQARQSGAAASASAAAEKARQDAIYQRALELQKAGMAAGTSSNVDYVGQAIAEAAKSGAAGAGAAAAKAASSSNWWDAAKKAATSGAAGLGAAFAGMFK
jgi:hypothetical protein